MPEVKGEISSDEHNPKGTPPKGKGAKRSVQGGISSEFGDGGVFRHTGGQPEAVPRFLNSKTGEYPSIADTQKSSVDIPSSGVKGGISPSNSNRGAQNVKLNKEDNNPKPRKY